MRRRGIPSSALLAICLTVLAACAVSGRAAAATVRIGYQKYGTLILLKQKGWLEPALAAHGDTVEWHLFTAGPQAMEALDAGAIDIATTGDAPPVAAQSNGTAFVYVGVEPPGPQGEAIVVPASSQIRSLADLRGKRIALNRNSNVHWLLLQALRSAGIPWSAITPVYLAPPDGRAAFGAGDVDAWAIWDPFLADAQAEAGARVLHDASGLAANHQFYLASRSFAHRHPDELRTVLASIATLDAWGAAHRTDVATLLASGVGLPVSVVRRAADRLAFGVKPLDAATIADQQRIADAFLADHLIPTAIRITDAVWPK